jgi:CRISPR system Cascade subunit CasE
MYLTRFTVNAARSGARHLIASPHHMHGAVCAAFPGPADRGGQGPRVLWRLDRTPEGTVLLYIVSPSRPDLTHLVEAAGWPTLEGPGWTVYDYGAFLDGLSTGSTWAFRLTANPVHHIRREQDPADSPTKRTAHVTPAHQLGWLLKRQEPSGFEVLDKPADRRLTEKGDERQLIVRDQFPVRFRRPSLTGPAQDVRFTRATYEGRLRVTDPARLRTALTHGLGKAKAYGCGLMTLAPLTTLAGPTAAADASTAGVR